MEALSLAVRHLSGFRWNFDHTATVVLLGLTVLGVVAGTFAAIFAVKGHGVARKASARADERWRKEIQPRVLADVPPEDFARARTNAQQSLTVYVSNVGGATTLAMALLQAGDQLYVVRVALGEHSAPLSYSAAPIASTTDQPPAHPARMVVARDVEGVWWDCVAHAPLLPQPDDFPEDAASIREWVLNLAKVGGVGPALYARGNGPGTSSVPG